MKPNLIKLVVALLLGISPVVALAQGQQVGVQTRDGRIFEGTVRPVALDTVLLVRSSGDTLRFHRQQIVRLSLIKRSSFWKPVGISMGVGFLLGGFLGVAGDEPGGEFSAGDMFIIGGLLYSGFGGVMATSIAGLKSIDVDIPWQRESKEQQRAILSQLASGNYRYAPQFRFSPWIGKLSAAKTSAREKKEATNIIGARLRLHFRPRAGIELAYARSSWSGMALRFSREYPWGDTQFYFSQTRLNYLALSVFVAFTHDARLNPFVSWGIAWVNENIKGKDLYEYVSGELEEQYNSATNSTLPLQVHAGAEIPVMRWFSLEGRGTFTWYWWQQSSHFGFQVGLNFGALF